MTSSLRNSIHRRNHKERSQLAHRSKFGILEKHADYVKRAQDYHSKQNRLLRLKQKAAERNKDEFYFAMRNERTKAGVHIKDRGNVALPTDIVKVLKTQDENYIRTVRAAGLKKIDKLKNQLTSLADLIKPHGDNDLGNEELRILSEAGVIPDPAHTKKGRRKPKHIVFVDGDEEAQKYLAVDDHSPAVEVDNDMAVEKEPIGLGWKVTEKAKKAVRHTAPTEVADDEDNVNVDQRRSRRRLLIELAARLTRDKQLRYAERELEMQRLMMGKGGRIKLRGAIKEGDSDDEDDDEDEIDARKGKMRAQKTKKVDEKAYKPRVYKWRLERKR